MKSRLRGHHLVCLRFFHGQGFPWAYGQNLRAVVSRASTEGVLVVEGADEVCERCPSLKEGLCAHGPGWEEEIRAMDHAAMDLLGVRPWEECSWDSLGLTVQRIFHLWEIQFCFSCQWRSACEEEEGYRGLLGREG